MTTPAAPKSQRSSPAKKLAVLPQEARSLKKRPNQWAPRRAPRKCPPRCTSLSKNTTRALCTGISRLERDGVLVSWALPKGLPVDPQKNHLAVHTEDHPLDYGSLEGDIPRVNTAVAT